MDRLLPGLRKFSQNVFPKQEQMFTQLGQGQKPHTLMITCSDSRIDPNLITQTKPGEIFVLRNAGNLVPPYGSSQGSEEAAIEFALDGLGVSNIVICGHAKCGAMAALQPQTNIDNLPNVKTWLRHADATKRRTLSCYENPTLDDFIGENVLTQIDNLKTHPSVSARLRSGNLRLYAWIYHFESGLVSIYSPSNKRFVPSIEIEEVMTQHADEFAL
jgi:carbonic anhydrase